jgi:tRNA A-37 threonylcarbamoyl transferase component Bud32
MTNTSDLITSLQVLGNRIPKVDLDCSEALTKLVVVRVVPDKRVVSQCVWQQSVVFAKFFLGSKSRYYAERDKRGASALASAGILTPALLSVQKLTSSDVSVLIYQAVEDALNAEQAYESFSAVERQSLINRLVKTIAHHHRAGLIQTDCYLKNFLIKENKIYTLDGDGVRQSTKLSQHKMLGNLSALLSKIDVLDLESWCSSLLFSYKAVNYLPQLNEGIIKRLVNKHRTRATSRFADQKVFRQCTDVNIMSSKNTFIAVSSHYSALVLPTTASQLDECFTQTNIIKDGNTCTVALVSIAPLRVVIKRYNVKNSWHGVSRAFRQTRASASWANAHRLSLLGLATAKPVALIETRTLGVNREAYFLTEYVDAPDTAVFFKQTTDSALRAQAVKHLVELFYRLYLLNISHGDTKASNIKVLSDGKPLLIDLDSMRQHRYDFFAKKAHARDIKRFMQNWKDTPSLYNAFVTAFKVVYVDHAPLQAAQILE